MLLLLLKRYQLYALNLQIISLLFGLLIAHVIVVATASAATTAAADADGCVVVEEGGLEEEDQPQ